jgi:hypothetical protein
MPPAESGVVDDDVRSHGVHSLVISTLNRKLASPVSRRDALNAELASLAHKFIKQYGPHRDLSKPLVFALF